MFSLVKGVFDLSVSSDREPIYIAIRKLLVDQMVDIPVSVKLIKTKSLVGNCIGVFESS